MLGQKEVLRFYSDYPGERASRIWWGLCQGFGGRAESILMSLPPVVNWRYDWKPEAGSREAELYERFLVGRDWGG